MISKISYNQLGGADHGWLQAKHHFSFASYHNPKRMHFGPMRVINDDIVAPHKGFAAHPHDNMEIITYVRKGAITHKDDMGNEGRTKAGDVQVMSAGTGVVHSEFNLEDEETILYQIWMFPNKKNVKPRWDAKEFPKEPVTDQLKALVTGFNDPDSDSLKIYQDATIFAGRMNKGTIIKQNIKQQAYVLCSYGNLCLNDTELNKGDGAEIVNLQEISITAQEDCEVLLIDLPKY
jgi:quercetin 2,3-dioxygenase